MTRLGRIITKDRNLELVQNAVQRALDSIPAPVPATIPALDACGAPSDITTLNATTSQHGLLPKLGGGVINFLRADGSWQLPTGAAGAGWVTDLDLDFTAEANQTLSSNTTYSIGGLTWTKINSANDNVAMAVVNGSGLVIQPKSTSDISGLTLPALRTPLSVIIGGMLMSTRFRVWFYTSANNAAAQHDAAFYAVERPNASPASGLSSFWMQLPRYNSGQKRVECYSMTNGSAVGTERFSAAATTANVAVIECTSGLQFGDFSFLTGTWSSGWPAAAALDMFGVRRPNLSDCALLEYLGAASTWGIMIGAFRAASATSLSITVARMKVEHLSGT